MNKTSISALVLAVIAVVMAGFGFFTPTQVKLGSYTPSYVGTALYPASAITLGAITVATSSTSTVVSVPYGGFNVGDACNINFNGAPAAAFGADAFITTSTASAATATVTLWNGASTALTLNTTSSITGASSTLKVTCFPQ